MPEWLDTGDVHVNIMLWLLVVGNVAQWLRAANLIKTVIGYQQAFSEMSAACRETLDEVRRRA